VKPPVTKKMRPPRRGLVTLFLGLSLPLLTGGCAQFRNEVVDAFETATLGLIDAAVGLAFEQFRSDEAP